MILELNGTKVTIVDKTLGYQGDNLVDTIQVTVDKDSTWNYKLDMYKGKSKCFDSVLMTREGNTCTVQLTNEILSYGGRYIFQLRGYTDTQTYHSDIFESWVNASIEYQDDCKQTDCGCDCKLPTEFYQVEDNITEINNHPPYPGDNNKWMIWDVDRHEYVESDIDVISGGEDYQTKANLTTSITAESTDQQYPSAKATYNVIEEVKANIPQPDYNQNDKTAKDYIKNRPFYTGDPVETVLVEESTVAFTEQKGLYGANFPSTFEATVGDTYKVSWDGTVYECTCIDSDVTLAIGNLSIVGAGSDTGEPFIMGIMNGEGIAIFTADTSASHTFSISGMVAPVITIDPKYLPMPIPFKPAGKSYLTFSSLSSFTLKVNDSAKHWDGTLEYFASDKTWTVWDGTTELSSVDNDGEYVLYLRGFGNTVITGSSEDYKWVLTGFDIKCIGNIENLLNYAYVAQGESPPMADDCFGNMFYNCLSLTHAPELPATELVYGCYSGMFNGCRNLTHAPALPATTLMSMCYHQMFANCLSLTHAPELPATTLANSCYSGMFAGCRKLTHAPALPATTLMSNCYHGMFFSCECLTHIPALPATTLTSGCYGQMFQNCTSLKLSSTQTGEYTQEYRIPSSGNGVTVSSALSGMFTSTGGTFTGTPTINRTYYLSSDNIVVRETEIATLNGYVGSMINDAIQAAKPDIVTPTAESTDTQAASAKAVWNMIGGGGSGTDISLGITGASVGEIIKVKAVDDSGKPTAWEAAQMLSGSGKAKSQILINQEITELTASLSVSLEHDFHNLTAIIDGGSEGVALTAGSDGTAIASKIALLIDTTSFGFNLRKVAYTDTSTAAWQSRMMGAEWSDDLSVFKRGFAVEIAVGNSTKAYYFPFGGAGAMYGTLGTDDNSPKAGKTANIVVNGAYLNVGTRVVLWGEYYE